MQLIRQFTTNTTLKCNTTNKILIQLTVQLYIELLKSMQHSTKQFTNAIQLIKHSCQIQLRIQSSIINCRTTNTVYVVHRTTKINRTDITSAVITIIQLIQLRHSPHSYHRVPSWQFSTKRKVQSLQINLQTTVWWWVVGPDYGV